MKGMTLYPMYPKSHCLRLRGAEETMEKLNLVIQKLEEANALVKALAENGITIELMNASEGPVEDAEPIILP